MPSAPAETARASMADIARMVASRNFRIRITSFAAQTVPAGDAEARSLRCAAPPPASCGFEMRIAFLLSRLHPVAAVLQVAATDVN